MQSKKRRQEKANHRDSETPASTKAKSGGQRHNEQPDWFNDPAYDGWRTYHCVMFGPSYPEND